MYKKRSVAATAILLSAGLSAGCVTEVGGVGGGSGGGVPEDPGSAACRDYASGFLGIARNEISATLFDPTGSVQQEYDVFAGGITYSCSYDGASGAVVRFAPL